MKKINDQVKIASAVVLLLFFSGCKKENRCDCLKRTGSIITETRTLSGFDKIIVEDNLNVFVQESANFEVKVEAGENIVPLIKTEVVGSTLTIKNDNRCNWTRSYKKPFNVYVKMPAINFVTSLGTGNIKSVNTITTSLVELETKNSGDIEFTLNNSKVISHMFGYGDIILHGNTQEHACSIGGDGFLYAADLYTPYTWIQTFTSGLCYIYASDLLICRIDKKGDVFCYGSPASIQKTLNGTGQLYLQ